MELRKEGVLFAGGARWSRIESTFCVHSVCSSTHTVRDFFYCIITFTLY